MKLPFKIHPRNFFISEQRIQTDPLCQTDMMNTELGILENPMFEECYQKILEDYKPKHKKVIFSLCTSTRPYYTSLKWSTFMKEYGNDVDLIVVSNAGIIPLTYCASFPYTHYNGPQGNKSVDKVFMDTIERRLQTFVDKFGSEWDDIVYTFLPTSRDYEVIKDMDIPGTLLPTKEVYEDIKQNGSPGVNTMRYPQLASQSLREIEQNLNISKRIKKNKLFG